MIFPISLSFFFDNFTFIIQHETGLCKNLLQEYAQKMNFAIPLYQCQKDDGSGRAPLFSCTVEIGGIRYIGAVAKTKKEAEIKAARTALLAIQSCPTTLFENPVEHVPLTVLPCKRKDSDLSVKPKTSRAPRTRKGRFRRTVRNKFPRNGPFDFTSNLEFNIDGSTSTGVQMRGIGEYVESAKDTVLNSGCGTTNLSSSDIPVSIVQSDMTPLLNSNFGNGDSGDLGSNRMNCGTSDVTSLPHSDAQTACGSVGNVAAGVVAGGLLQ